MRDLLPNIYFIYFYHCENLYQHPFIIACLSLFFSNLKLVSPVTFLPECELGHIMLWFYIFQGFQASSLLLYKLYKMVDSSKSIPKLLSSTILNTASGVKANQLIQQILLESFRLDFNCYLGS